jgi:hypothetical protein
MQGKGSVGKSLVSSILIQYLLKQGQKVSGCDTDPVNSSLARHESLDVKILDIMDSDDIDPGRFDELIRHIDACSPESHLVVDIGASCFVSLCAYLKKYEAFDVLREQGHTVYIHSVITGGVNLLETLNNYASLVHHFDVPVVVWLNPFFGDIKIGKDDFENLKIYHETVNSIHGIVKMPKPSGVLFERDFAEMQAKHLTFEEAVKGSHFYLMNRQRLVQIWRKYQAAIAQISLV